MGWHSDREHFLEAKTAESKSRILAGDSSLLADHISDCFKKGIDWFLFQIMFSKMFVP